MEMDKKENGYTGTSRRQALIKENGEKKNRSKVEAVMKRAETRDEAEKKRLPG